MHSAPNVIFRTLADPTRRAVFERLARAGEQAVGALTSQSGVSQPAVSTHLAILKLAGLCTTGTKACRPITAPGRGASNP